MVKSKKRILVTVLTFLVLLGLVTPTLAATKSKQTVNVKLELGEQFVDMPVSVVKTMDYALELTDELYIVNHIDYPEVKEQYIEEDEAYELGFIDNIVENIPEDVELELDVLANDKTVIVLGDNGYGNRYKQVIREEEVEEVEEIIEEIKRNKSNKETEKKEEEEQPSQPEKEDHEQTGEPGKQDKEDTTEITKEDDNNEIEEGVGSKMAPTATNIFNLIGIGLVLGMVGTILFFVGKRKKNINSK